MRDRIYRVIRRIPNGRVATYGQIALLAGVPGQARQVGYALNASTDERLPWHRVINAQGRISLRADSAFADLQRTLLEAEDVEFDAAGRVNLARYQWRPRRAIP